MNSVHGIKDGYYQNLNPSNVIESNFQDSQSFSSGLITNYRTNSPSLLGDYIVKVISLEEISVESTGQKVLRCTLYLLGATASTISCVIPCEIALNYHNDTNVLGIIGVAGVLINFNLFGTWGYILLARQLMEGIDPEYRILFKSNVYNATLAAKIFASVIWGSVGRLPSAGAVIQFNQNVPWALATLVGGAGPNIWSAFKLISQFFRKVKSAGCFSTEDEVELEKVRDNLLSCFLDCKQMVLNMSHIERKEFVEALLQVSHIGDREKLSSIFSKIKSAANTYRESKALKSKKLVWIPRIANAVMFLPATLVLVQSLFLAHTAADHYIDSKPVSWSLAALATTADIWITYDIHNMVTNYLCNKVQKCFTKRVQETTFTETIYPRLQVLLDLVALSIALTPFAELISIAEQCAENYIYLDGVAKEAFDGIFIYGSYIGWTVLLFKAVEDLIIESSLRKLAQSRFGGEDAHNAALILDKLDKISLLIEKVNPSQLSQFLLEMPFDSPLKETDALL